MNHGPVPHASIVALTERLVQRSSRAGVDASAPILDDVQQWLHASGLASQRLQGADGDALSLYAEVTGLAPGERWTVLDATLDTAEFGDLATWTSPPTDGRIANGWLHGRGSADSKAGAAVFLHLLREFAGQRAAFGGRIGVLLDLDEHTGRFGGARAFFDTEGAPARRPDGVMIGYPGIDRIVVGSRGFLRARLTVHGIAAHAGSSRTRGVNAIMRAVDLLADLKAAGAALEARVDETLGLAPALTVTGVRGGGASFSAVPDRCEIGIDLRLTLSFDDAQARALMADIVARHDGAPTAPATEIAWIDGWPAYHLPAHAPMVEALRDAAAQVLDAPPITAAVGPSNIGNYLAQRGVPAIAGFGVRCEGIHAADERIDLSTIGPVYRVYRAALQRLHG